VRLQEKPATKEDIAAKKKEAEDMENQLREMESYNAERKRYEYSQTLKIKELLDQLKEEEAKLKGQQVNMKTLQVDIKEKEERTEQLREDLTAIGQQIDTHLLNTTVAPSLATPFQPTSLSHASVVGWGHQHRGAAGGG